MSDCNLFDWTTAGNDAIKYYSGAAQYRNQFELYDIPEGDVYIDLGTALGV